MLEDNSKFKKYWHLRRINTSTYPLVFSMATTIARNLNRFKFCLQNQKILCYVPTRCSSEDLLYSLIRRGLIKEIFPRDHTINAPGIPCAYAGFDATADSLHIGNLLVIVALLHWQRQGYKSIAVIGDSTAEIGDPSGHKTDRQVLSREVTKHNAESIKKDLEKIFTNYEVFILPKYNKKGKSIGEFRILKNSEWYESTSVIDFVSQAGRNIRIGDMLSRTSVKTRMESGSGMNFSEFSYQVFQSYDWLHLFKAYDCRFQFGGSDQLGNITSGYSMISGTQYQQVYGCLLPLIQSESGDKFGKSSGNTIYLSAERTSPFDFYQFFMRLPDVDIEKFLKLFTFLSTDEIEKTVQNHMKNPDSRKAQKKLAEELTLLVHGEQGLELAQTATKILYQSDLYSLAKLNSDELQKIFPLSTVSHMVYEPGISLLDLAMKVGCFLTEEDGKRIITGGGMYLNFEKMNSPISIIIPEKHILSNSVTLIRIGKKNYYIVIWK